MGACAGYVLQRWHSSDSTVHRFTSGNGVSESTPARASSARLFAQGIGSNSCQEDEGASDFELLPAFEEVLKELEQHKRELGGVKNFTGKPQIQKKVKAADFRNNYTDFEYIYLTVLGFAKLQWHCEEIVGLNNDRVFTENPGTRLLERVTGITMHGEREGAVNILRSAAPLLLEAFSVSKRVRGGPLLFFREAFDRLGDPCLEGRVSRIADFLSAAVVGAAGPDKPQPEDLALQSLPSNAGVDQWVGEHLRVFVNRCTWAWAQERGLGYKAAQQQRELPGKVASFSALCNAESFEAAVCASGFVSDVPIGTWEVELESGAWSAYQLDANTAVEQARLLGQGICEVKIHAYVYEIDLLEMAQVNLHTGKERRLRWTQRPASSAQSRFTSADLKAAIQRFVELETLPASPNQAQHARHTGYAAARGGPGLVI